MRAPYGSYDEGNKPASSLVVRVLQNIDTRCAGVWEDKAQNLGPRTACRQRPRTGCRRGSPDLAEVEDAPSTGAVVPADAEYRRGNRRILRDSIDADSILRKRRDTVNE